MRNTNLLRFNTFDGLTLEMTLAGAGPPIVFLHGAGGERSNWDSQLAYFAAQHLEIAAQVRGYGQEPLPGPFRYEDCARDLHALLVSIRQPKAHIVGLSMGGRIAQEFYHRYPQNVISLVLCSTDAGSAAAMGSQRRREEISESRNFSSRRSSMDARPAIRLCSPRAVAGAELSIARSQARVLPDTLAKVNDARLLFDRTADLPKIRVPTLVICGEDDRLTTPDTSEALAAAVPGARFASICNAGHVCNVEQPDSFNRLLDTFLLSTVTG